MYKKIEHPNFEVEWVTTNLFMSWSTVNNYCHLLILIQAIEQAQILFFFFFLIICLCFFEMGFLCIIASHSGIYFVGQAGLELKRFACLCLLSAGIKLCATMSSYRYCSYVLCWGSCLAVHWKASHLPNTGTINYNANRRGSWNLLYHWCHLDTV